MVTSEGQWPWDRFHHLLPNDVLEYIVVVKAPGPHASSDTHGWSWEDSSVFTSFGIPDSLWALVFGSILWNLWGSRNRKIFDPDAIDGGNVLERCRRLAMEATRAIESKHLSHRSNSSVRQSSVRRNPPRSGVWKLNVDGARNLAYGSASCDGVIRDSHGTWIVGFSKYIDKCSTLEAEF
ncbi:hypothetical protein V6N11_025012 [Hibiscus sabdariffa]|uniref:RNase H type-1 domain-containing protein n=1 Tax=Hibiscus sabdariffa TaxID=183260 RepID=A0ABR2QNS3_9ROSI